MVRLTDVTLPGILKGCFPLKWCGSRSTIQDHGDSKEAIDSLWERIYQFLCCTTIPTILNHWCWSRWSQKNSSKTTTFSDIRITFGLWVEGMITGESTRGEIMIRWHPRLLMVSCYVFFKSFLLIGWLMFHKQHTRWTCPSYGLSNHSLVSTSCV